MKTIFFPTPEICEEPLSEQQAVLSSDTPSAPESQLADAYNSAPNLGWIPDVTSESDVILSANIAENASAVFKVSLSVQGFSVLHLDLLDKDNNIVNTREVNYSLEHISTQSDIYL